MKVIETAEMFLDQLGFKGSRVKIYKNSACIQLMKSDIENFAKQDVRVAVLHRLQALGVDLVTLDLTGR